MPTRWSSASSIALAGALALVGCARRDPPPAPPPASSTAPQGHGEQALIVQPGDVEAPHRDLERIPPLRREGAPSVPVQWETEIRNRCPVPARFAIGPVDAEIGADTPIHTLAPGEGVSTHLADDEYVLLITAPGESSVRTRAPGGWVILQGGERCDHMTALHR